MQLILFILAFMVIGYILARTESSDQSQISNKTEDILTTQPGKLVGWWQARFGGRKQASRFRAWVGGTPAGIFPEDFKTWLAQLSSAQAVAFTRGLNSYAHGLGYDLDQAIEGGLDKQPRMKSVFVEAIVVYSQAYRKAKQVNQENEKKAPEAARQEGPTNDKQTAEKTQSRRRNEPVPIPEAAAAD